MLADFKLSTVCLLQEHTDYELVQSTNPEFNKAVVRVNIFREHRQTILVSGSAQYLYAQVNTWPK